MEDIFGGALILTSATLANKPSESAAPASPFGLSILIGMFDRAGGLKSPSDERKISRP